MNIVVMVTAKDLEEAEKISHQLLEQKLIACANIIEGVKSFFFWQGKIDQASEAMMVLKTKKANFKKIAEVVRDLHRYDVPEIIALSIVEGDQDYLRWIDDSLR